jgi:hypothetical protein
LIPEQLFLLLQIVHLGNWRRVGFTRIQLLVNYTFILEQLGSQLLVRQPQPQRHPVQARQQVLRAHQPVQPVHRHPVQVRQQQVQVRQQLYINMKAVKNICNKDLEVSFDFYTYSFPKNRIFMVDEDLLNFLQERYPMVFSFDVEIKKVAPQVKRIKTKSLIKPQERNVSDMQIGNSNKPEVTFGGADLTPPDGTVDKDGVGWYGEGITVEGGQNVS